MDKETESIEEEFEFDNQNNGDIGEYKNYIIQLK